MNNRGLAVILMSIILQFVYLPVMAQEREIEDKSPPSKVSEIEAPIQKTFQKPEERPDFLGLEFGGAPFFADARFEVRLRSYYMGSDASAYVDSLSNDWAGGGSLYYQSGWFRNLFSLEAEVFTSQLIYTSGGSVHTGLLSPDNEGYTVLGLANAKFQFAGLTLTGGRRYMSLPYVNKSDFRMTPNTFEGVILEKREGKIKFNLGYITKIKFRNSDEFVWLSQFLGLEKEEGQYHGGLVWNPKESFAIGTVLEYVPNVFEGLYAEVLWYEFNFDGQFKSRLDTQFTYGKGSGSNLLGLKDTWNYALRISTDFSNFLFRLGFSLTGPEKIISTFGSQPTYVGLIIRNFTRAEEKALMASITYDFEGVGLHGFKTLFTFCTSNDALLEGQRITANELNLTLDYRGRESWMKGAWFRIRLARLYESWAAEAAYQIRMKFYYTFVIT